jgi:hypothetical protein
VAVIEVGTALAQEERGECDDGDADRDVDEKDP